MLTGYNTDVSYEGDVFHVQTEDKGLRTPIILSLVYRAGTILAAKRTSYDSHIKDGVVDEEAVAQILNKQHQILVAAIKAGKSEKLAAMSRQQSGAENAEKDNSEKGKTVVESPKPTSATEISVATPLPPAPEIAVEVAATAAVPMVVAEALTQPTPTIVAGNVPAVEPSKPESPVEALQIGVVTVQQISFNAVPEPPLQTTPMVVAPSISTEEIDTTLDNWSHDTNTLSFDQIISGYLQPTKSSDQLRIELLYPSKFSAGDEVTVRAAILFGGHSPASNAMVKLQILGTRIDPQTISAKTDFQGLVSFSVKIPTFNSGAAALVLTAKEPNGQETESKYMIRKK